MACKLVYFSKIYPLLAICFDCVWCLPKAFLKLFSCLLAFRAYSAQENRRKYYVWIQAFQVLHKPRLALVSLVTTLKLLWKWISPNSQHLVISGLPTRKYIAETIFLLIFEYVRRWHRTDKVFQDLLNVLMPSLTHCYSLIYFRAARNSFSTFFFSPSAYTIPTNWLFTSHSPSLFQWT